MERASHEPMRTQPAAAQPTRVLFDSNGRVRVLAPAAVDATAELVATATAFSGSAATFGDSVAGFVGALTAQAATVEDARLRVRQVWVAARAWTEQPLALASPAQLTSPRASPAGPAHRRRVSGTC
jgi:hypothetical protein